MRLLLLLPFALALPALAQDKPRSLDLASALPAPEARGVAASVQATVDGLASRASVGFSAPDGLRFDVEADAAGSPARSGLAAGQETLAVEGKRARRTAFNGLSGWFRDAGEPLLQALGPWLSPIRELENFYTLSASREGASTIVEARANDAGKYLRREVVRAGGAGAQRFYAARQAAAWNRPARIRLRVENKHIVSRQDFGSGSNRPLQSWLWRYENDRPTLIEARDGRGVLRGQWRLSFEAARPPAALELPPEAIVEGDAPAGDAAAQAFARGVRAAQLDNYAQAVAALNQAAGLKPRAVAVPLALFEIALTTRSDELAQAALLKIQALEGEQSASYLVARARLALQKGAADLPSALDALPQVLAGVPNAPLSLEVADLLRAGGQRNRATALLLPLLDASVPVPIAASAASRLDAWFAPSEQAARDALAAQIAGVGASAQVARALLKGQAANDPDASRPPELEFLLAQQAALAGRDEEAAKRWKNVSQNGNQALWLSSQLALAQLAARRGDAAGALAIHRAAWPLLPGERAREGWLRALLSSWLKANQTQALRGAVNASTLPELPRSKAGDTSALDQAEADARLLVAVDEAEGDATSTLRSQAARWKSSEPERAAWWQGKLAEALTAAAAQAGGEPGTELKRERLYNEALKSVGEAGLLDAQQPFYAEQKLLIAARRVAVPDAVTDAATGVRNRENEQAALEAVRARFGSNPDALLSAGLALLTMKQEREAAPLLKQALAQLDSPSAEGAEDAAGERVARITARASLAGALRKAGDVDGAMRLYALLFQGARSPVEQGTFAANWVNALFDLREAGGAASILSQVARTGWKPSQTQEVLAQVLAGVSVRPPWRAAIRQSFEALLQSAASPPANAAGTPDGPNSAASLAEGAALVAAYLDFSALNSARRALLPQPRPSGAAAPAPPAADAPGAPNPAARQSFNAAVAVWKLDMARLQQLAASARPGVAGQALSLLAQDALLRGQPAEAGSFFERALSRVPWDEGLALSLSNALAAQPAPEDAVSIVRARDALLARLPLSSGLLQQAAQMSLQAGETAGAKALLARARALAFFDNSVSAGAYDDLSAPPEAAANAAAAN